MVNLRKLNAVASLITTILFLNHAIFYSVWMLFRGGIRRPAEAIPWILVVMAVVHAALSVAMAVLAHKGEEKRKYRTYAKLNAQTMIQRMTGILMLFFLIVHIFGAATHFQYKVIHSVCDPLFFAVVLAHTAVSTGRAFVTLGVGTAKFIKVFNLFMAILCGVVLIASAVGFYLCLFWGVAT